MNNKTNMKKEKKIYESPQLTVVEFRTERGFATSGDGNMVFSASQAIDAAIAAEMAISVNVAQQENGNVIASNMAGNEDNSNVGGSSGWQYANGGWF